MKGKKTLIIGGVAGGASAAARLRRLDEDAEIILFERDEHISFANCGLPYYIGGTITDRSQLLIQTPEAMNARFNIDVRVFSEVVKINPVEKTLTVNSKDQGIYEETYDNVVLAPGARALTPNIPGINHNKIMTLRNVEDTDRIKVVVDNNKLSHAVVIGGGFVGVEMAENLVDRGVKTSLVEAAPHVLAPFDYDMVDIAENKLIEKGIDLILNDAVSEFNDLGDEVEIILNSGKKIVADLVILSIGVAPDTEFLKDSGIEFGPRGHIIVNERLETAIEGVYAVGDAIEVVDYTTKLKTAIALAGPANKQGRIVADNISGRPTTYKGSQGTSVLKIFDLTAASTGANERALKAAGLAYRVIHTHPISHASYYPGASTMTIKLIFNDEGSILGAQAMGYDGVDKRIDVIATVMRLNGTVTDLTEIDLSYAPPYSSAKDPVNMAGYVAENILSGLVDVITWEELKDIKEDYTLLDVRTVYENNQEKIKGSINIPVDDLRARMDELDKDKVIMAYCRVGIRGYIASRILSQNGFKVKNITGGALSIDTDDDGFYL